MVAGTPVSRGVMIEYREADGHTRRIRAVRDRSLMSSAAERWQVVAIKGRDGNEIKLRLSTRQPDAPVCILIHGTADAGFIWDDVVVSLQDLCRPIVIDLRGHGDSQWVADHDYSPAAHVADIERVIEALAIDRYVLIGHSLGGQISIHLAARRPREAIGMLIADFGPETNADARERARLHLKESLRRYRSIAEYQQKLFENRPLISANAAEWLARESLRACPEGGFELKVDPAMAEPDSHDIDAENRYLWAGLRRLACPVLVVRGAGSATFPRVIAERMRQIIPNGRLEVVPAAGHALMVDNPAGFAQVVRRFVQDLRLAQRPGALSQVSR
jgi:esterase